MVLCGLLSLCAQFHTRPLPLFGRVKSVGSYPLSLRLQCKCFRKIISRSRRAATARARAPAAFANFCGRALYFPGVRSHFLLQLLAVISTQQQYKAIVKNFANHFSRPEGRARKKWAKKSKTHEAFIKKRGHLSTRVLFFNQRFYNNKWEFFWSLVTASLFIDRNSAPLLQFDKFFIDKKFKILARKFVPYGSDIVSLQSWVLF